MKDEQSAEASGCESSYPHLAKCLIIHYNLKLKTRIKDFCYFCFNGFFYINSFPVCHSENRERKQNRKYCNFSRTNIQLENGEMSIRGGGGMDELGSLRLPRTKSGHFSSNPFNKRILVD